MRTFYNLIGKEWVGSRSGKTFERRNPANIDEVLGVFPRSDAEDVGAAVDAARKAFREWSETPAPVRGRILREIGRASCRERVSNCV